MNQWLKHMGCGIVLSLLSPMAGAIAGATAVEWDAVTQNAVGDRFLVDTSSIQRKADSVFYWEYREFPQPNDAFLDEPVDRPVHGVMLNWSANCSSKTQRLRQITAYDKDRKVIKRFAYGDTGTLQQPKSGSSADKVLNYVCDRKSDATADNKAPDSKATESKTSDNKATESKATDIKPTNSKASEHKTSDSKTSEK